MRYVGRCSERSGCAAVACVAVAEDMQSRHRRIHAQAGFVRLFVCAHVCARVRVGACEGDGTTATEHKATRLRPKKREAATAVTRIHRRRVAKQDSSLPTRCCMSAVTCMHAVCGLLLVTRELADSPPPHRSRC